MIDSLKNTKGSNQGSNQIWLSVAESARLADLSAQSIRAACKQRNGKFRGGHYLFRWAQDKNGGGQYEILLTSLPKQAQERYAEKFISDCKTKELTEKIIPLPAINSPKNKDVSKHKSEPTAFSQHEYEALWATFKRSPEGNQQRAEERCQILDAYFYLVMSGLSESDASKAIQRSEAISATKLWRLIKAVQGHDRNHWLPLLATNHQGRQVVAKLSPEAWDFFCARWLTTSEPPLLAVYEETVREGKKHGWIIPSYKTVARKAEALPETIKVAGRKGVKAVRRMHPAQQRDYTTLAVHQLWESDGRRADLFCSWPDGYIGRPFVVVWRDVRTRIVLGARGFKNANMAVVRLALRNAIERCNALPQEGLLDNGMEYAAKGITGGQKTRYRFKDKEDDPLGVLTLLGVPVHWATPGWGQAKPIESFWGWVANHVDRRSEFVGAYCGNSPATRPEGCDPKKAIPIEQYSTALASAMDEFNQRPHRGQGMQGKSPLEIYSELMAAARPRLPSRTQLLLCLMESLPYRPDKEDGSITINGVRYWHQDMSNLPRYKTYHVRYDPEDPTCPALILDRNRVVCEAAPRGLTPFLDRDSGKAQARDRGHFVKTARSELKAIKQSGLAPLPQPQQWIENAETDFGVTELEGIDSYPDRKTGEIFSTVPAPKVTAVKESIDQELVNKILTQDLLATKPIPSSR